jgi:hypothetical protein
MRKIRGSYLALAFSVAFILSVVLTQPTVVSATGQRNPQSAFSFYNPGVTR